MALSMDYHQDLMLPAEALALIAGDTGAGPATRPVWPSAAGPAHWAAGPA
jgi:hypothetical protein